MRNIILSSRNTSLIDKLKEVFPHIEWILIEKIEDFALKNFSIIKPDFIFVTHWSYIIPEEIFNKYECIVFHMTDLPYGRGGSPLQNLIVRGKTQTKISALRVIKEIDAGDIYLKKDLSLYGTAEEIFIRANHIIGLMIEKIIKEKIKPVPQKGEVTKFKRRNPKMSNIKNIKDLEKLFDYIRMLDAEGYPLAFFENEYFKFEFSRASLKAESIIADVKIIKK